MRALVTGAAGFVGSHLAERLVQEGHSVIGVDSFTEYYDRALKERNLQQLRHSPSFRLAEADLAMADLDGILEGTDLVFHLAGQPGVRNSWGEDFQLYVQRNIWATQRLLEAVRRHDVQRLVFASSSSVYGNAECYPTRESDLPQPISPYGVSKLAAEQLCMAYWRAYRVPVVSVRYFTVYGPRQRPDMAFTRFTGALVKGDTIDVFGDGKQTRDFTYVDDAVAGTFAAAASQAVGEVFNVGGGAQASVLDVIALLGEIVGKEPCIRFRPAQPGDVRDTGADISKARTHLAYHPTTALAAGLRRQVQYYRLHSAQSAGGHAAQ